MNLNVCSGGGGGGGYNAHLKRKRSPGVCNEERLLIDSLNSTAPLRAAEEEHHA